MEQKRARDEEERLMQSVYRSFERNSAKAAAALAEAERAYKSGGYEDANAHLIYAELRKAQEHNRAISDQVRALYNTPYHAHIGIQWADDENQEQYLLSDSEDLDSPFNVTDDRSVCIVPFKQESNHPLYNQLRLLISMPDGGDKTVVVNDAPSVFTPQTIRKVAIERCKLENVQTLYDSRADGESAPERSVEADDLLSQRLEENRSDARMRNIIATLQRQQFEIIQSDISLSFAVQGCAGSGKTQCMIHRLFFLRESLSESGWDKVMLITPTQLFRDYSSELMRRYRLSGVANLSLAEFYRRLLCAYDPRFRDRQYAFELTEEYLPDSYLKTIYSSGMITTIDNEIQHALHEHVDVARTLLGEADDGAPITAELIGALAERLTERIAKFDETERTLSELPEYAERKARIEALEKQLRQLHRRQDALSETAEKLAADRALLEQCSEEKKRAEFEIVSFKSTCDENVSKLGAALHQSLDALAASAAPAPAARYAEALFNLCSASEDWGESSRFNREYLGLLEQDLDERREKLRALIGNEAEAIWLREHEKRVRDNNAALKKVADDIARNLQEQDEHSQWLSGHHVENAQNQRLSQRSALERARYYLSRIESSVFEHEVWDYLEKYKKNSGITTLKIEQLPDGHQKQTRILYKSDLLFYLKIYAALRPSSLLPDYNLLCIDEGQDLHSADYALLRRLYPRARFNIFGDTVQSLHEGCGVSDWKRDAGVETVFTLNSNYRNAPAIVAFCNRQFGEDMKYCGDIRPAQCPTVLKTERQLAEAVRRDGQTVILKDRSAFEALLRRSGLDESEAAYIDTTALSVPEGKIACYTIFAAKGLEFTDALVYAQGMSRNQKIVACTRAMERLDYFE